MNKLSSAEVELEKYKKLVKAQKEYRENSIASLKMEIASKLYPVFEDFYETENIPMNEMLGEIYRQKLIQIAKILKKYDINVK